MVVAMGTILSVYFDEREGAIPEPVSFQTHDLCAFGLGSRLLVITREEGGGRRRIGASGGI